MAYGKFEKNSEEAYGYLSSDYILTEHGFKTLEDVAVGEKVISLNPSTMETCLTTVTKKEEFTDVDSIVVKNERLHDTVGPFQGIPVFQNGTNEIEFSGARKIVSAVAAITYEDEIYKAPEYKFISSFGAVPFGKGEKTHTFSRCYENKKRGGRIHYEANKDLVLPIETAAKFVAFYMADGKIIPKRIAMAIKDRNPIVFDEIRRLFNDMEVEYEELENTRYLRSKHILTKDWRIYNECSKIGLVNSRRIPRWIMENPRALESFYTVFSMCHDRQYFLSYKCDIKMGDLVCANYMLALDCQEMLFRLGIPSNIQNGLKPMNKRKRVSERTMEQFKKTILVRSGASFRNYINEKMNGYNNPRKDKFIGITTKNGIWMVSSGGYMHWTGGKFNPKKNEKE